MKLGVITDIHNNLTALRAVVERLRYLECDRIICGRRVISNDTNKRHTSWIWFDKEPLYEG